jgi:hypothetical protein
MKILFVVYCGDNLRRLEQTLESIPRSSEEFQSKIVIVNETKEKINSSYEVRDSKYKIGPIVSVSNLLEPDINFLSIVRPGDVYLPANTRCTREKEQDFFFYMRSMGDDLGIIYSDYTTEIAQISVNVYQNAKTVPPLWGSFINTKALTKCNCLNETDFEEIYKKISKKFVICHVPKFLLHLVG